MLRLRVGVRLGIRWFIPTSTSSAPSGRSWTIIKSPGQRQGCSALPPQAALVGAKTTDGLLCARVQAGLRGADPLAVTWHTHSRLTMCFSTRHCQQTQHVCTSESGIWGHGFNIACARMASSPAHTLTDLCRALTWSAAQAADRGGQRKPRAADAGCAGAQRAAHPRAERQRQPGERRGRHNFRASLMRRLTLESGRRGESQAPAGQHLSRRAGITQAANSHEAGRTTRAASLDGWQACRDAGRASSAQHHHPRDGLCHGVWLCFPHGFMEASTTRRWCSCTRNWRRGSKA